RFDEGRMPTLVGIDIGATAIKVAVIRSTYRRSALAAIVAVDVAQHGSVAEAIRTGVSVALGGKVAAHDGIATSIEGARAALRTLELPASAQKQLNDVLGFELESAVPFDLEGAVFDYRTLTPREGQSTEHLQVLCAVAKIDDVRSRIDAIREAI